MNRRAQPIIGARGSDQLALVCLTKVPAMPGGHSNVKNPICEALLYHQRGRKYRKNLREFVLVA